MTLAIGMDRLALYFRTARYLKPRQVAYRICRRIPIPLGHRSTPQEVLTRRGLRLVASIIRETATTDDLAFEFLNVARKLDRTKMDWDCADLPKLWRYNLHYFNYALDSGRSARSIESLIADWIRNNPPGKEIAWDPYPVSLRIVNWIKFVLMRGRHADFEADWARSLYAQALWLEDRIEYDLLANHILKNAVALLFAGAAFDGRDAQRWFSKGLKLLVEQLEEQILPDGGHFEHSLMYHAIVVEDMLDVINLFESNPGLVDATVLYSLKEIAERALKFLALLCYPDGEIPLFNDAAINIAAAPSDIFAYAFRTIGFRPPALGQEPVVIQMPQSGYFGCRNGSHMLLIDCGPIGPDYQPGHGHCDLLSYELILDGRRLIVDSGVHDYEDGALRRYVRSTAAHNTVRIDGLEQSEIWAVFRVARRAVPGIVAFTHNDAGGIGFTASHDGYSRLNGRVTHQRSIEWSSPSKLCVADCILGTGRHLVEDFIHIHPAFSIAQEANNSFVIQSNGTPLARLAAHTPCAARLETSYYCPEFGKRIDNAVAVLSTHSDLPVEIRYTIEHIKP